jgi:CCR4-NOT complex subunit CAF16
LAYINGGELKLSAKLDEIKDLKTSPNLLSVVEAWLRSETKVEKKTKKKPVVTSPFMSSRQMAYYR